MDAAGLASQIAPMWFQNVAGQTATRARRHGHLDRRGHDHSVDAAERRLVDGRGQSSTTGSSSSTRLRWPASVPWPRRPASWPAAASSSRPSADSAWPEWCWSAVPARRWTPWRTGWPATPTSPASSRTPIARPTRRPPPRPDNVDRQQPVGLGGHQRPGRLDDHHRQFQRRGGRHRHRRGLQPRRSGRQHLDEPECRQRRLRRRRSRLQFRQPTTAIRWTTTATERTSPARSPPRPTATA